jgi:hypothetical protein
MVGITVSPDNLTAGIDGHGVSAVDTLGMFGTNKLSDQSAQRMVPLKSLIAVSSPTNMALAIMARPTIMFSTDSILISGSAEE